MRNKTFKWLDFIAGLLFTLWVVGLSAFWIMADSQKPMDLSQKTDAVIVLTGGPDRVNLGFDLIEQAAAKHLFISGVDESVTLDDLLKLWPAYDDEAPLCCVTLGYEAKDTSGNALETQNWIAENDIGSIRLVTAAYHMPRAKLEFKAINNNVTIYVHPVHSSKEHNFSWRRLRVWLSEYHKTMITFIKPLFR